MKNQNRQFYLVDFQILSEAIKKTIQTKELLKEGEAETINEAVKKTGISRSAYYSTKIMWRRLWICRMMPSYPWPLPQWMTLRYAPGFFERLLKGKTG